MSFMLLGILNAQASGGSPLSYDHLETVRLTSSSSGITFSGLNSYSDYKHLQIRYVNKANSNGGSGNIATTMRFNNDSSSSYTTHFLRGSAGGSGDFYLNQSNIVISQMPVTFGSQNDNMFAATVVNILDFQNSNKNTTVESFCVSESYTDDDVILTSGLFEKTTAIDSINFKADNGSGSFSTDSRFSIYGIRG
jgi:hypothetical protein